MEDCSKDQDRFSLLKMETFGSNILKEIIIKLSDERNQEVKVSNNLFTLEMEEKGTLFKVIEVLAM